MDGRYALLIANSVYEDPDIPDLKTPPRNLVMLKFNSPGCTRLSAETGSNRQIQFGRMQEL